MANHAVGLRIEKIERLISVSTDVLRTVFEIEMHPGAVPLRIKPAGNRYESRLRVTEKPEVTSSERWSGFESNRFGKELPQGFS
jgi:hypothetical protein